MKMNKRLLSLVLALVMLLGMIPLNAIATDETDPVTPTHIEGCGEECAVEGCTCTCHAPAHIDTCLEGCAVEGCACLCHQPAAMAEVPCGECGGVYDEDGVTVLHESDCPSLCTCEPVDDIHVGDYIFASEVEEPVCNGKADCPVEDCENDHCTGDENCPIENCACKAPLCDKCEATKAEDGVTIVHEENCLSKCKCEAVIEGYHSNQECPFYVEPVKKCEFCQVELSEGAVHAETCLTHCTCDPKPAEGEDHKEGCKFYVEPEIERYPAEEPDVADDFIRPVFFAKAAELVKPVTRFFRSLFRMTPASKSAEGVVLDKTATTNDDGTFTLTLESYVTGQTITGITNSKIPADIVVVIDESGSMKHCMVCNEDDTTTHKLFCPAEELDENKTYHQTLDDGDKVYRYYCDSCCGWFNKRHGTSHGGTHIIPYQHSGEKNQTGVQFYNDAAAQEKAFYPNSANLDITKSYYLSDGTEMVWCTDCGRWQAKSTDHASHTYATAEYPLKSKDAATCTRGCWFNEACTSRDTATRAALNNFLDSLYTDAKGKNGEWGGGDDVAHRVAILQFGNKFDGTSRTKYSKYLTYINASGNNQIVQYPKDTANIALASANSLRSVLVDAERTVLNNAVTNLEIQSGTPTQEGLYMAKEIFTNNPDPVEPDPNGRNKVCILFTDGAQRDRGTNPTTGKDIPFFHRATECIGYAKDMKELGVSMYGVGVFVGADASSTALTAYYTGDHDPDSSNSTTAMKGISNCNRFMQLVSSNYPDATSMTATGNLASDLNGRSYYLSAGTADELNAVFQNIASQIQQSGGATNETFTEATVVRDVITPTFQIPRLSNGTADTTKVRAWTETYKGTVENGQEVAAWENDNNANDFTVGLATDGVENDVEIDGNTVDVTGFDFAENYVGMDKTEVDGEITEQKPHGKKLVIEIIIKPIPGFLGGDNIETNESSSGIYTSADAATPEAYFPIPEVDITVKPITPQPTSKDIYLSQWASLPELINVGTYSIDENGDGVIDPETEIFTVDTQRNSHVNIVYTIEMPEGQQDITYTIYAGDSLTEQGWSTDSIYPVLTADTTYPVTCTVTSAANSNNKQEEEAETTVQVYKPVITFQDSAIELGEKAKYDDETTGDKLTETRNFVSVVWKHGDTEADPAVMGAAPSLKYEYTPPADYFKEEKNVQVTVTAERDFTINVPEDMPVTNHVTFVRKACECYADCTHNEDSTFTVAASDTSWVNFVVHVKSFDLTIIKAFPDGADYSIDDGQTFVFNITGPNNFKKTVIIEGEGKVTIAGLPVGSYTITEDTDWSWRYTCNNAEQTVAPGNVSNGTASVTFTNTRKDDKWLDGNAFAANSFQELG